MPVRVGAKLFEGAQANIYRLEAELDSSLQPLPNQRFASTPQCEWVVKVMGSRDCLDGSEAALLVPAEKRIERDALKLAYDAAKEASQIAHSNFIPMPLVELNPSGEMLSIVMPRKAGTLSDWLGRRNRPVTETALLSIAEQLVSAVAEGLHKGGSCHLDLSLSNVLVDDLRADIPNLFICDLESATLAGRAPSAAFTEEYSAPERAASPGPPCDVFSLGVMLYTLGARPDFPGLVADVPGVGSCLLNQRQLTPTRIAAALRRDLKAFSEFVISIVTMMLNHDPKTRPRLPQLLDNIRAVQGHLRGNQPGQSGSALPGTLLEFPYTCGPLDLVALPAQHLETLQLYPGSLMYDLHGICANCNRRRSLDKYNRFDCTASNDLHLPGHASPVATGWAPPSCRDLVIKAIPQPPGVDAQPNAPPAATAAPAPPPASTALPAPSAPPTADGPRFGLYFLYPMVNPDSRRSRSGENSSSKPAEQQLQLQGGFAWTTLNEQGVAAPKPFAARALRAITHTDETHQAKHGQDSHTTGEPDRDAAVDENSDSAPFFFTAAQPWISSCTAALHKAGRIHREVPLIFGAAKSFCWILPNESFKLENGEEWIPAEDGGFVFFFGDDPLIPNEQDRFFAVAPNFTHNTGPSKKPFSETPMGKFVSASGAALGTLGGLMKNIFKGKREDASSAASPNTSSAGSTASPTLAPTPAPIHLPFALAPSGSGHQQQQPPSDPPESTSVTFPPAATANPQQGVGASSLGSVNLGPLIGDGVVQGVAPTAPLHPEPLHAGFNPMTGLPLGLQPAGPPIQPVIFTPQAISLWYRYVPCTNSLAVDLEPKFRPPSTFRINISGESGICSEAVYLSPNVATQLQLPKEAKYVAFMRVEESFTDLQRQRRTTRGSSSPAVLPQHGFVALNIRFQAIGLLPLYVIYDAVSPAGMQREAQLRMHPGCVQMDLLPLQSDGKFKGTLPPAVLQTELVEDGVVRGSSSFQQQQQPPQAQPLPMEGGHQSTAAPPAAQAFHSPISTGSGSNSNSSFALVEPPVAGNNVIVGYLGWEAATRCFSVSDSSGTRWFIRKWKTIP